MRAPCTAKFSHDVTCVADRSVHICVSASASCSNTCQEEWLNMGDKVKGLAGDPGGGVGPVKGLEGSPDEEGKPLAPREFFWDSIVIYVVSSIIALASVETISEFIRGSQVNCLIANETESDVQTNYVNSFCSSSLPPSQYFTVFLVVHAILMVVPHYLWLNLYGAKFEYFFQLAPTLDRLREESSGDYSKKNALIFEQLEMSFSRGKWMFRLYVGKLVLQWLFSVVGLIGIIFFFTDFNVTFDCPRSLAETLEPFWPLPGKQAICVFTSLRLISVIRIADIILVSLVVLGLGFGFIWCFSPHTAALGSDTIAKFSFYSSLHPEHYHSKTFPIYSTNRRCPRCCIIYPRISTDLDFMMVKLFRTDGGLGRVMKSVQISKKIKELNDAESRRLNLLSRSRDSVQQPPETPKKQTPAFVILDLATKHKAPATTGTTQAEAAQPGTDEDETPAVGALCVMFGSPSFSFPYALQSLDNFSRVGHINFSPFYSNPDVLVKMDSNDLLQVVTFVTSDDILATSYEGFLGDIYDIWEPGHRARREEQEEREQEKRELEKRMQGNQDWEKGREERERLEEEKLEEEEEEERKKTDYIVVGPISKDFYKDTVHLLMTYMEGNLTDSVTLLTVHPLMINGTEVEGFQEYIPDDTFTESKHSRPNEKVYVTGPPSQDVPEIQCQFKFTLYVKKRDGDDEDTMKGQTGVDMEGTEGSVKGQVEPERRSLLDDFSDREDRHQQRDKH